MLCVAEQTKSENYMKIQKLCMFAFFFLIGVKSFSQKQQTINYFKNDTLSLDLDLFLPENISSDTDLPLVIFVHGGGFSGGTRDGGYAFCKYMAQNGYAAATITYTLYMKNKKFSCDGVLPEKIKAFNYGANDLWLSTLFFLNNATKYHINPEKIFIAGSSAGGETVLHAAFWNQKLMAMYGKTLPENFKYAGLISGAGAIMDLNLITKENKIPMFFFHGNGDVTVPYGTAAHHYCPVNSSGWLMLFGSYSIFNHLKSMKGMTHLYSYCGGGHEYSAELFNKNQAYILTFMNDVLKGKVYQKHTVFETGKKNHLSAAYNFCK